MWKTYNNIPNNLFLLFRYFYDNCLNIFFYNIRSNLAACVLSGRYSLPVDDTDHPSQQGIKPSMFKSMMATRNFQDFFTSFDQCYRGKTCSSMTILK